MRSTCALCGETSVVHHGHAGSARLCRPCSRVLLKLSAYLESRDSPAALIASDHTVLFANRSLRTLLAGNGADPAGRKIGEVLECKHALTEDNCKETVMCPHCDLRRSVDVSRITGEKLTGVLATLHGKSGGVKRYSISTEKAGEAVLLTVRAKTGSSHSRTLGDGQGS